MKIIEDRYDGVTIDIDGLTADLKAFKEELINLITELKNKKLLWIKVPAKSSQLIPILTELDFEFHHCIDNKVMLVKKLITDPIVPNAKNFNAGVGAVVLDEGKLLVIKDRFSQGYKLPGGHVDPKETLPNALIREVFEETGVKVTFQSVINIGHFLVGQFGEQNLYFACIAKHITKEINIYDTSEIIDAKWIDVKEFLNCNDVNVYNKAVVSAVVSNTHSELTLTPLQLTVPGEVFL